MTRRKYWAPCHRQDLVWKILPNAHDKDEQKNLAAGSKCRCFSKFLQYRPFVKYSKEFNGHDIRTSYRIQHMQMNQDK